MFHNLQRSSILTIVPVTRNLYFPFFGPKPGHRLPRTQVITVGLNVANIETNKPRLFPQAANQPPQVSWKVWTEGRTQAPPVPGHRGEVGSPRCWAHSRVPYPFCNRYYHSKFLKVIPYHQNPAFQAFQGFWKVMDQSFVLSN